MINNFYFICAKYFAQPNTIPYAHHAPPRLLLQSVGQALGGQAAGV